MTIRLKISKGNDERKSWCRELSLEELLSSPLMGLQTHGINTQGILIGLQELIHFLIESELQHKEKEQNRSSLIRKWSSSGAHGGSRESCRPFFFLTTLGWCSFLSFLRTLDMTQVPLCLHDINRLHDIGRNKSWFIS